MKNFKLFLKKKMSSYTQTSLLIFISLLVLAVFIGAFFPFNRVKARTCIPYSCGAGSPCPNPMVIGPEPCCDGQRTCTCETTLKSPVCVMDECCYEQVADSQYDCHCEIGSCSADCLSTSNCTGKCSRDTRYYDGTCDVCNCFYSSFEECYFEDWSANYCDAPPSQKLLHDYIIGYCNDEVQPPACDSYVSFTEIIEDCDSRDRWFNTGKSYFCCDGHKGCVCQEKQEQDWSCSEGSCMFVWGETMKEVRDCSCELSSGTCKGTVSIFCSMYVVPKDCEAATYCEMWATSCVEKKCEIFSEEVCNNAPGCTWNPDNPRCGAECVTAADCPGNHCSGDLRYRYYNRTCTGDCVCSYSSENCDSKDGWYCASGEVREQRNYYCDSGTVTCKYTVNHSNDDDCDDYDGCSNGYWDDYSCAGPPRSATCQKISHTCTDYCCELYHGDSDAYCSAEGVCMPPGGPPTTTILCDGADCTGWYKADVAITLDCSDPGSDCATTYYCVDTAPGCTDFTSCTPPCSSIITTEGTNYIRYYSEDNAGHIESPPNSETVNLDKTPPSTVSVIGAPEDWQNSAEAGVYCEDSLSGPDNTTYGLLVYDSDPPGGCSNIYSDYEIVGTGSKTISSYSWVCGAAKDLAGNIGFSSPIEFKVEKDAPTVSVKGFIFLSGTGVEQEIDPSDSWRGFDVDDDGIEDVITAKVDCNDALSDCKTDSYRLKTYSINPGVCSTSYAEYTPAPQIIPSYKWVCAVAKDNAGNEGYSSPEEFKVDKIKPTSLITFPLPDPETGEHPWYNEDFPVQVDDEDDGGSGLATCYRNVCRDWNEIGLECSSGSWTKWRVTRDCNSYFTVTVGEIGEGKDCDRGKICAVVVFSKDIAENEGEVWDRQWYNIGIYVPNSPPKATDLGADPDNPALCCGVTGYPPVRFSWQFSDPNIGDSQEAKQIQIDEDLNFGSPIDSEIITGEPGKLAEYAPTTLSFNTTYYWRVRVWDEGNAISDCGNPDGWCYPPNSIVVDNWPQSSQLEFEAGVLTRVDTSTSPGNVKIEQRNGQGCWGTGDSCDPTNCKWSSTTYQSYHYSGGCQQTTYCRSDNSYKGSVVGCSDDGTGNCYKLTGSRTRYTGCVKSSICAYRCEGGNYSCSGKSSSDCTYCGCTYDPANCENDPGCSCDPGLSPGQCSACKCTYDPAGPCGGTNTYSCHALSESWCKEFPNYNCCEWIKGPCVNKPCLSVSDSVCQASTCGCTWDPADCSGSCSCGNITLSGDCTTCPGCEWDSAGPCSTETRNCINLSQFNCQNCSSCSYNAYKWNPSLSGQTTVYSSRTTCSFYKYFSLGTIASQVKDTGSAGTTWDQLFWVENLQPDTNITFKVRAWDEGDPVPSWTDLGLADSPITSGLPSGRHQQWQATLLASTDYANTPILESVIITYSAGTPTPPPGDSFTTILHPFPYVNFDWIPKSPVVDEVVQFCSVYEKVDVTPCDPPGTCGTIDICPDTEMQGYEDRSICYRGIGNADKNYCDQPGYGSAITPPFLWEITPVGGGVFVGGTNKNSPNPRIQFLSSTVTLTITDTDDYVCPESEPVPIALPLPKWKEIKPF